MEVAQDKTQGVRFPDIVAWSNIMARNFGIRRPRRDGDSAPIWPLLVMTTIIIGIINAAPLLHYR
jgi:hypothetical protein